VFVRPAQGGRDVERPPSGIDDRQDVGSQGIADHQEPIRCDAAICQDAGVHVGRLVADDLDIAKALAQARALQLRRLVQQIPLRDEHQRPPRCELRQRLVSGGEQLDVFGQHLPGERDRAAQVGA
jgi:hypothetical protein